MTPVRAQQGSEAWATHRASHFNASDASAMMGVSPYTTRSELLARYAGATEPEIDTATAKRFQRGHDIEAATRPLIEAELGEELSPMVAVSDEHPKLSASFDGITFVGDVVWECKTWNAKKAEDVEAGRVPECDYWQCVQQLLVSGAERLMYTLADEQQRLSCNLSPNPDDFAKLLAGWAQFETDLKTFQPVVDDDAAVHGTAALALPNLHVELTGRVTASNLAEYKAQALAAIGTIKTELATDQDFADAEAMVKLCDKAEKDLAEAKARALDQTADIATLFSTLDDVRETLRQTRLKLDRQVKQRKDEIRIELVSEAQKQYAEHVRTINNRLQRTHLQLPEPDFRGAIKGKRTLASLREALDTCLVQGKVNASAEGERLAANLVALHDCLESHPALFPDVERLAQDSSCGAVARQRIAEHEKQEAARIEAAAEQERARIRAEEQRKAEAEARRKVAEEADEARRQLAEEAAQQRSAESVSAHVSAPTPAPTVFPAASASGSARVSGQSAPTRRDIEQLIARSYHVSIAVAQRWLRDITEAVAA